jgi:protein-L-isoaspartate(D-aspartate) O-methyltransferase
MASYRSTCVCDNASADRKLAMRNFPEDPAFSAARHNMVEEQLRQRGIRDERVLAAMARIPRHLFSEERYLRESYGDHPVPIASGQTISQPFMVALMLQALRAQSHSKVLEIGTGTGYQAALLAELAAEVVSVERIEALACTARENLSTLGIKNVKVIVGDGSVGYLPRSPYDRIIVAAAAPHVPVVLTDQLAEGGILLIPVGGSDVQVVNRITRVSTHLTTEQLDSCRFVPLIGEHGHRSE